jgi:hypothetical protein
VATESPCPLFLEPPQRQIIEMTKVRLRMVNGTLSVHRRDGLSGMISAQPQPAKLAWQTGKNGAIEPVLPLDQGLN